MLAAVCARIAPEVPLDGLEVRETAEPEPVRRLGSDRGSRRGAELPRHLDTQGRRRHREGHPGRARERRRRRHGRRQRSRRACRPGNRRGRGTRSCWPPTFTFSRSGGSTEHSPRGLPSLPESRAEAPDALVCGGGLPADGIPDRVQDALHPRRLAAWPIGARSGRRRRGLDGLGAARARSRAHGLRHEPERGKARPRARARRHARLRAGQPAPDARRRGHGDRRPGHLGSLPQVVARRRHARRRGRDDRRDPPADLARLFWRQLSVVGSSIGTLVELQRLCAFLEQTGVRPLVDSQHALADARVALARLEAGAEFGKIVVLP